MIKFIEYYWIVFIKFLIIVFFANFVCLYGHEKILLKEEKIEPINKSKNSLLADTIKKEMLSIATSQIRKISTDWDLNQRDCAGFIRYLYRKAIKSVFPNYSKELWLSSGVPTFFADAKTLLKDNFTKIGRDSSYLSKLQTGDVLAYMQENDVGDDPLYHLMMVMRTDSKSNERPWVIYHTSNSPDDIRWGKLYDFFKLSPYEWKPSVENKSFLGFYRWNGWQNIESVVLSKEIIQ